MAVVTQTSPLQVCGCSKLCCPHAEPCLSPASFPGTTGQQHPLRAVGCGLAQFLVLPAATVALNTWLLPAHFSPDMPWWLLGTGQPLGASLSPCLHLLK